MANTLSLAALNATGINILDHTQQFALDVVDSGCQDYTTVQAHSRASVSGQNWNFIPRGEELFQLTDEACNTTLSFVGSATSANAIRAQTVTLLNSNTIWHISPVNPADQSGTYRFIEVSSGSALTAWANVPNIDDSTCPLTLEYDNPNDPRQQFFLIGNVAITGETPTTSPLKSPPSETSGSTSAAGSAHQRGKSINIGAIAGGVVSGVLCMMVVVVTIVFLLRRRRKARDKPSLPSITPFVEGQEASPMLTLEPFRAPPSPYQKRNERRVTPISPTVSTSKSNPSQATAPSSPDSRVQETIDDVPFHSQTRTQNQIEELRRRIDQLDQLVPPPGYS